MGTLDLLCHFKQDGLSEARQLGCGTVAWRMNYPTKRSLTLMSFSTYPTERPYYPFHWSQRICRPLLEFDTPPLRALQGTASIG